MQWIHDQHHFRLWFFGTDSWISTWNKEVHEESETALIYLVRDYNTFIMPLKFFPVNVCFFYAMRENIGAFLKEQYRHKGLPTQDN